MHRHLALVGAGHAHMTVVLRLRDFLERGHRATVISPSRYQYYSGMGPGMLSGMYCPRQIRFNIRKMVEDRGGEFIEAKVIRIDPAARLLFIEGGRQVAYDVASFNTGSGIPLESLASPEPGVVAVKPIINLYRARQWIKEAIGHARIEIAVVGGGPAGVEISANLWRLVQDSPFGAGITLIGGSRVMGDAPPKVRKLALESLTGRNIRVLEGVRAESAGGGRIELSDGSVIPYDIALMAVGVRPSSLFKDSGIPADLDGAMTVDRYLRSISHPELFGGGDCVSPAEGPIPKVGVYAVRQNPILHRNLTAALDGGEMRPFDRGGNYMLIMNMGDGTGILWKGNLVFDGRFSFILKDYIDKRFMRRFQVSGELTEPLDE